MSKNNIFFSKPGSDSSEQAKSRVATLSINLQHFEKIGIWTVAFKDNSTSNMTNWSNIRSECKFFMMIILKYILVVDKLVLHIIH